MEADIEKKKKSRLYFFTMDWGKVHPSFQHRAGGGWICIHEMGPWENVSLGCIVSHIRSHLDNHLPTSLCSSSLSPPLALSVHSSKNTQNTIHRPHSSRVWVTTHKPALIIPCHAPHTQTFFFNDFTAFPVRQDVIRFRSSLNSWNEREEMQQCDEKFLVMHLHIHG